MHPLRQEGIAVQALVVATALVATFSLVALLDHRSKQHVAEAGFWFDHVTFEVSRLDRPITREEQNTIRSLALMELQTAYRGLRVAFSEDPGGLYRVRVVQQYPPRPGPPSPVGQSLPLGPFGGEGSVSFQAVADLVIHYAPPETGREALVEAMARGVGRTAVHEFAHQILFGEHVPRSADPHSYEYETADRAAQYFGSMHWDTAWPFLVRKLGR
jgi:hypothetical protein